MKRGSKIRTHRSLPKSTLNIEEENIKIAIPVVEFFQKCLDYLEVNLVGKILVPSVSVRGEIRHKEKHLEQAYQLGQTLA